MPRLLQSSGLLLPVLAGLIVVALANPAFACTCDQVAKGTLLIYSDKSLACSRGLH